MKRPELELERAQRGPRLQREPNWNERSGKRADRSPPGGADGDIVGGRGNQALRGSGGAPNPEDGRAQKPESH